MSLLVFVPNASETNPLATLKSVGLESLHDDGLACMGAAVNTHGPDGGGGALFGWPGRMDVLSYTPSRQTWHKCAPHGDLPGGRAWIGWDNSAPPTPERLLRKKPCAGEMVELADGQQWLILHSDSLPRTIGIDPETGELVGTLTPEYQPLLDRTKTMLSGFREEGGQLCVPAEVGFEYAVYVLSLNYRMCRDLAATMGLFNNYHFWSIPITVMQLRAMVAASA
jgi:hypothetical protein